MQHFLKNGGRQLGSVDNNLCLVALDSMSIEYCYVVLCIVFIYTPLGSRSEYQSSSWYKEGSFITHQTDNLP